MGFGGHAQDMNNRMRYNKMLRKHYRQRHKRILKSFEAKYPEGKVNIKNGSLSKEEIEAFLLENHIKMIQERKERVIKASLLTVVSIAVVVLIIIIINQNL